MELLNSKIDHKDCCAAKRPGAWSCANGLIQTIKLLYDIYHMQIDEGDVIRTISDCNHQDRTLPYRRRS